MSGLVLYLQTLVWMSMMHLAKQQLSKRTSRSRSSSSSSSF